MGRQKPWFIKVWVEGKYVDLWAVNHILAGAILAGIFTLSGLNLFFGLAISTVLMIAWEVIEIWQDQIEFLGNKVLDVLLGIAGYVLMYLIVLKVDISQSLLILFVVTPIWVILETWGFLSLRYEKKKN